MKIWNKITGEIMDIRQVYSLRNRKETFLEFVKEFVWFVIVWDSVYYIMNLTRNELIKLYHRICEKLEG